MPTPTEIYRARPTDAEVADVLDQRLVAAFASLNDEGSIHLTYVIFVFEDGVFRFETSSVTRKARNVAARGTASILVEGRASSGRTLMVAAEGTARVIEPPDAEAINRRIREKYVLADAVDDLHHAWNAIDDVAIELTPVRWRTWTGALLRAETEAKVGRPYLEIWKPD